MVEITSEAQNKEKAEKYCTRNCVSSFWTRNTEVQINEKEIGKLLEKEFRIMIVKMIKSFENKMEKTQDSINKDPDVGKD